jgi:hydrogenase nickel incorporation protein HypA/HybF
MRWAAAISCEGRELRAEGKARAPLHEMGLAMSIYRACREAVAGHGAGTIEWVRVAVGELSAVEPDLLRFAWEAVTTAGPDSGARLDIEWCPARQHCPACGEDKPRRENSWLPLCPDCGAPLEVEGGQELEVLQLSFLPYDGEGGQAS